jgi:hypothetical protein
MDKTDAESTVDAQSAASPERPTFVQKWGFCRFRGLRARSQLAAELRALWRSVKATFTA